MGGGINLRFGLEIKIFISLISKIFFLLLLFFFKESPCFEFVLYCMYNFNDKIRLEGFSDDLFRTEMDALADLDKALKQEIFLREKGRTKWLVDGDRNTEFFHSLLKRRKARKPLSSVQIGDKITTDPNQISDHVKSYYEQLPWK